MTYKQALRFLERRTNYEHKRSYAYHTSFNLKRIQSLLTLLGNPERSFKSIVIGGTNGKGSTAVMCHALLHGAGYKVGLYTSPHLFTIRERIRIDSRIISPHAFRSCMQNIKRILVRSWDQKHCGGTLTYFEVLTALAFLYFAKQQIDYAVVEVGLGGRLDATNVLTPLCSIITSIGYDHTHLLGNTLSKIAYEKAGIIKKNGWIISAHQQPAVQRVLRAVAKRKQATVVFYGKDFSLDTAQHTRKGWRISYQAIRSAYIPLRGTFQLENAALAFAAVNFLVKVFSLKTNGGAMKKTLRHIQWPGRYEIIAKHPTVVIDGAHNECAMRTLVADIKRSFPHKQAIVIYGASHGKHIDHVLKEVTKITSQLILTQSNHERACSFAELKQSAARYVTNVKTRASLGHALRYAFSQSNRSSLLVITGSLFIAGEAKRLLGKGNVV